VIQTISLDLYRGRIYALGTIRNPNPDICQFTRALSTGSEANVSHTSFFDEYIATAMPPSTPVGAKAERLGTRKMLHQFSVESHHPPSTDLLPYIVSGDKSKEYKETNRESSDMAEVSDVVDVVLARL
jgi:hypothetical protein